MNSQARATGGSLGMFAVVALATTGCTICPSPYDYSGPVPNGSVTQNDFCARSGGNRPLRNAPLVWPQVVQADERPEAAAESVLETGDEEATGSSVLVAVADDENTDGGVITTSAEVSTDQDELIWRRPSN